MKIKIYLKNDPIMDYTSFIDEYQKTTTKFIKDLQKYNLNKEDLMIDKLICMHSCTNMDAYNQILMKNDIEELLSMMDIHMMKLNINDNFNPNIHELRQPLYDNYKNYKIKKIIDPGFIRGNKILKKAIVEVERKQDYE